MMSVQPLPQPPPLMPRPIRKAKVPSASKQDLASSDKVLPLKVVPLDGAWIITTQSGVPVDGFYFSPDLAEQTLKWWSSRRARCCLAKRLMFGATAPSKDPPGFYFKSFDPC